MSEVQFNGLKGNYNFYHKDNSKPAEENKTETQADAAVENRSADPSKVLDALNFMGAQNFINVSGKLPVDPMKHLSLDRISDIEASMAKFEENTEKYAKIVKAEFGDIFDEKTVYALAANAFSINA